MKSEQLFSVEGYGVIVTGGASGLGLAFTEALAENGARVTMLDVDAAALARYDDRVYDRRAVPGFGVADEQEVLFPDGRGPDGVFHQVVVEPCATVLRAVANTVP